MALIPCPECDKKISEQAHICPKCGFPYGEYRDKIAFQKAISRKHKGVLDSDVKSIFSKKEP